MNEAFGAETLTARKKTLLTLFSSHTANNTKAPKENLKEG